MKYKNVRNNEKKQFTSCTNMSIYLEVFKLQLKLNTMKEKEIQIAIIVSTILSLIISCVAFSMIRNVNKRIDRASYEYQLIVEDYSVKIFEGNRYVGTESLEGQLGYLIIADNQ